jgi:hypothetical protein
MPIVVALAGVLMISAAAGAEPQRRGAPAGTATFAIMVTDTTGAPIGDVKVTVSALTTAGASVTREGRTEAGRLTFEHLPLGNYRIRFDREGFIPLERELTGRAGAPIDVKVTLNPAPLPPLPPPAPAPPKPAPAPAPALSPDPVAIDMPSFIEKNYIGRGDSKSSILTCTTGGPAVLLQIKQGVAEPARPDADEFLYVIAGEGIGRIQGRDQSLRPGTFMMVPRGVARTLASGGRTPLVLLSIRAGEKCSRP